MTGKPPSPPDVNDDGWSLLGTDLGKLPDGKFLKVYTLLEQLGDKPELAGAFATMRPRLQELRPPRRPTLSRLFFRPAEDLLDDAGRYARKLSRVSRATLAPCWKAVREHLDPRVLADAQQELALADLRDGRAVARLCQPLWEQGAAALAQVLQRCDTDLKYKAGLFGRDDDVLRQVDTLRQVIAIGKAVEELKAALPEKPIGELTEAHQERLKEAVVALGQEDARRTTPLLLVLTSRMKRPGDLLRLMADLRLGGSQQEKDSLAKEMSGYVVGNLLRQTAAFENGGNPDQQDAGSLAATAERLTEGLNSVNETVQSLRDRDTTQKVQAARSEIGSFVVKSIVADLDKTLVDTLFTPGGAVAADEQVKKAEQLALALRRSSKLAPHLGIQKEVGAKITQVRQQIEGQAEAAMRACPRAADGSLGPEGQRQMFNSLRMIEILAGSDEAERMYKDWKRRLG